MKDLLKFELRSYFRQPAIYLILILFTATGFLAGARFTLNPGQEIYRNAPYAISSMTALLSLLSIFIITLLGVQILFREKDAGFSPLLFASPLSKKDYLYSRIGALFLIGFFCMAMLSIG